MLIFDLIPDADVLLNLAPEELAYPLLQVAESNLQNQMVHRDRVVSMDGPPFGQVRPYERQEAEVRLALTEALMWLEVSAILLPATGTNGNSGWRVLGRRARGLLDRAQFDNFRSASLFPKALLHPKIADRVWIALARGELSDAVFIAFRAVEEAVRAAGGFSDGDYGNKMMRSAFNPENGPLTDDAQLIAERNALSDLFAGAIGSYKNPHSHRTVTITDRLEAQEMVMLASHLLRIVDSRVSRSDQLQHQNEV